MNKHPSTMNTYDTRPTDARYIDRYIMRSDKVVWTSPHPMRIKGMYVDGKDVKGRPL